MEYQDMTYYDWEPRDMVEVNLPEPDNFLKIRETLTRIGVASDQTKSLFQSCHILHKQGKYFIVHFKEMFVLDGKYSNITVDDIGRRNTIARLLENWGLLSIVNSDKDKWVTTPLNQIKVIPHKEKSDWDLIPKYRIGTKLQ